MVDLAFHAGARGPQVVAAAVLAGPLRAGREDLVPQRGFLGPGELQRVLPNRFLPVYDRGPLPPACMAKARCRYVSGLGAHSGHDRSFGVYLCPFGHVRR